MKISTCLHTFVVACLFCLIGCSSSDPTGNEGAGANGNGIGPHGDKPSAIQNQSCIDAKPLACVKYSYNSHGDIEREEGCKEDGCQQWCEKPVVTCSFYEYDDKGRVYIERSGPDCSVASNNDCNMYTFEGEGKGWVILEDCSGVGFAPICRVLTYTAQGQIETSFFVDCQTKKGLRCDRYAYDQQGRLIEQTYGWTCDKQEQVSCLQLVYEGDLVRGLTGDGNCENLSAAGQCLRYFY